MDTISDIVGQAIIEIIADTAKFQAQLLALQKQAAKVFSDNQPGSRAFDPAAQSANRLNQRLRETSNIAQTAGRAMSNAGQQAARAFETAAKAVSGTLTAAAKGAAAAVGGIAAVAVSTGIAFNILQQKAKIALETLLGVEQARDLLKEVNTLVDESPFSRSNFLEATQQLVSFGVAAKDVVPILDAVQNAVAGIGGSSEDINLFAGVFAQIQSQGRITGDELLRLQEKGIDAATIIGEAMGQSGAQIKEEISKGAVGAEQAISALVEGINEKFGGAAAGLRNTFLGAVDRVKAALRDIGANLTAAFIDPLGGGKGVEGVNNIATALRNIQKGIVPALLPLMERMADLFLKATVVFLDFTDQFVKLDDAGEKMAGITEPVQKLVDGFSKLAPLLAAAAGAAVGLLGPLTQMVPVIGPLLNGLHPLGAAIIFFVLAIKESREAILQFGQSLIPVAKSLLPAVAGVMLALQNAVKKLLPPLLEIATVIIQHLAPAVVVVLAVLAPLIEIVTAILVPVLKITKALGPLGIGFLALGIAITTGFAAPLLALVGTVLIVVGVFRGLRFIVEKLAGPFKAVAGFVKTLISLFLKFTPHGKALVAIFKQLKKHIESLIGPLQSVGKGFKALGGVISRLPGIRSIFDDANDGAEKSNGTFKGFGAAMTKLGGTFKDFEKNAKDAFKAGTIDNKPLQELLKLTDAVTAAQKTAKDAQAALVSTQKEAKDAQQGVADAIQNAAEAQKAITDAQKEAAKVTEDLNEAERERAEILSDTGANARELADAERDLLQIRFALRDLDQEEVSLLEDIQEIRDSQPGDLAQLDRDLLRAKLALGEAQRKEAEALKETNKEETQSIDLTGLSIDQIKTRLANLRAANAIRKKAKKDDKDKTQAEIDADLLTNKLDTEDALAAVKEAELARNKLLKADGEQLRENEEKLQALAVTRQETLASEEEAIKRLTAVRAGDTEQNRKIRDLDKEIAGLREAQVTAAEKIVTARAAEKDAVEKIATARAAEQVAVDKIKLAQEAVTKAAEEEKLAVATLKDDQQAINDILRDRLDIYLDMQKAGTGGVADLEGKTVQAKTLRDSLNNLQFLFDQSAPGQSAAFLAMVPALAEALLKDPRSDLRALLQRLFGSEFGFAKGGVITDSGVGSFGTLYRAGEFGAREMIGPLTNTGNFLNTMANGYQYMTPALKSIFGPTLGLAPTPMISAGQASMVSSGGGSNSQRLQKEEMDTKRIIGLLTDIKQGLSNAKGDTTNQIEVKVGDAGNAEMQARRTAREIQRRLDKI